MQVLTFLALALTPLLAAPDAASEADFDYRFEGRLMLQLKSGRQVPLRHVELRVRREDSPTRGLGRHIGQTDDDGNFSVVGRFARDRDGALPGRRKIRFLLEGRFDNSDLEVRPGGWFQRNWFIIAKREGRIEAGERSKTFDLGERVIGIDPSRRYEVPGSNDIIVDGGSHLANEKILRLANIYWVYSELRQALEDHDVGIPRKTVVRYPQRNVLFGSDRSFYLTAANLGERVWNAQEQADRVTMIHEAMHQWDINHLKGEKEPLCLFDAHHQSARNLRSSRCSGFMEGFAEAVAQRLNPEIFGSGEGLIELHTMKRLRDGIRRGDEWHVFPTPDRKSAEKTDHGWRNFLQFMMAADVWAPFNSVNDGSCQPRQVEVWELLRALKAAAPSKVTLRFVGTADFEWLTDILVEEVDGFGDWDARFYQMLGDPSNRAPEIHADRCERDRSATASATREVSSTPGSASPARSAIGWHLDDGDPVYSKIAGRFGEDTPTHAPRTRRLDLGAQAMTGLRVVEHNDRPCSVMVWGLDTPSGEDVACVRGGRYTDHQLRRVSLKSPAVRSLAVCANAGGLGRKGRVKGVRLRGAAIRDDGSFDSAHTSDEYALPNCGRKEWTEPVSCESGHVATGVIAYFRVGNRNQQDLHGLQLICREVVREYR